METQNWKKKCVCGCIKLHHEWSYANNIMKVEECKICPCKGFEDLK